MQAISIRPEWAHLIYCELKTVECRTWRVKAPCDLLMCTSARGYKYFPGGYAVAVIHVTECVPFTERHLDASMMEDMPEKPSYAWLISGCWAIDPFPVKGKLHIFDVPEPEGGLRYLDTEREIYDAFKPLMPAMPSTFEDAWESEDFGLMLRFDYQPEDDSGFELPAQP